MDYFFVSIALIYIIIAAIFDIKTKEVPDWLSFSLIAIGVFSNFLYSLVSNQWGFIIYSLIGLLSFLIFGTIMYYAGQWGGGDAKLLVGIGALLPQYPKVLLNYFNSNLNIPFLVIVILNILIIGGIYGILYSIYAALKNKKSFLKEIKLLVKKYNKQLIFPLLILLLITAYAMVINMYIIVLFVFIILFMIFIFFFIKAVENVSMYKIVKVNKLVEGDWVVQSIKAKNKIIFVPKLLGISKQDIQNFKRNNIKQVLVKDGLAFVPAFLVGFLISLIWGNIFLFII